jgi:hypothetical protein
MRSFVIIVCMLLVMGTTHAQVIHIGLKGGANLSWMKLDDPDFNQDYDIKPTLGFNAGMAFSAKLNDRYFLHSELAYSKKGKVVTGKLNLHDRMVYDYIEIPLTFNVFFDAKFKMQNVKHFKWYLGAGPNLSYWLGGRGRVINDELREYSTPGGDDGSITYTIKFGSRGDTQAHPEIIYVDRANRRQFGINFGGGIFLEPLNGNKIMLDVRFEWGHSWMGKSGYSDYVFPTGYGDALQARNMGLRLSAMYMLEFSTDKKIMNKGKSTGNRKMKKRR